MGSLGRHQTVQIIGGNEQIHHKGKHENHQEKIGSQKELQLTKKVKIQRRDLVYVYRKLEKENKNEFETKQSKR